MKVKIIKRGKVSIYAFDNKKELDALSFIKEKELSFYPNCELVGNKISRDVYSNYMQSIIKLKENSVITLDSKAYDRLDIIEEELPDISNLSPNKVTQKDNISNIANSKIVFIGGRGLGSKSNYDRLKKIATKFGAACGCSRPVAMNGWESYDNFVGISGHILESDLIVTFGVSGAGPLVKGICKAKKIIAINNDKNALIFSHADYGIVSDVMEAIKYLEDYDIR